MWDEVGRGGEIAAFNRWNNGRTSRGWEMWGDVGRLRRSTSGTTGAPREVGRGGERLGEVGRGGTTGEASPPRGDVVGATVVRGRHWQGVDADSTSTPYLPISPHISPHLPGSGRRPTSTPSRSSRQRRWRRSTRHRGRSTASTKVEEQKNSSYSSIIGFYRTGRPRQTVMGSALIRVLERHRRLSRRTTSMRWPTANTAAGLRCPAASRVQDPSLNFLGSLRP